MLIVLTVALPVFALIAVGAIVGRCALMGPGATVALNQFVMYLALPAVLFQAMARIDLAQFTDRGFFAAYAGAIAAGFGLSLLLSRAAGTPLPAGAVQALAATFNNTGYVGLPICLTAFGPACLPAFRRHPGADGGGGATRAPLLGLLYGQTGLGLPAAPDRFLTPLGAAATPCALVAIGLQLTQAGERFHPGVVARLVAIKLVVQPAAAWLIAFHLVSLPPVWAVTAVVMSALPTGTSAFLLSQIYGREAANSSGTVLVSTTLSFFTLSLLLAWFAPLAAG